jgi:hypothetical protein
MAATRALAILHRHAGNAAALASNESTPVALQAVIPEIEWRRRERENVCTALQLAKGRIYGPDGAADILGVKPTTLISRLNLWVCESRPSVRAVARTERNCPWFNDVVSRNGRVV